MCRLEAEPLRRFEPDGVLREAHDEHLAPERPRGLGGEQAHRSRPGDEDAVSGRDLRRVEQAVADAGERLAEGGGVLAEPVGDPVQVPRRTTTWRAKAPSTNEPIERRSGQRLILPSEHHSQVPQVEK